jgi:hypothetical protein
MLYRELYHRHLYLKLGNALTIEQRIESWDNYVCDLPAPRSDCVAPAAVPGSPCEQ